TRRSRLAAALVRRAVSGSRALAFAGRESLHARRVARVDGARAEETGAARAAEAAVAGAGPGDAFIRAGIADLRRARTGNEQGAGLAERRQRDALAVCAGRPGSADAVERPLAAVDAGIS